MVNTSRKQESCFIVLVISSSPLIISVRSRTCGFIVTARSPSFFTAGLRSFRVSGFTPQRHQHFFMIVPLFSVTASAHHFPRIHKNLFLLTMVIISFLPMIRMLPVQVQMDTLGTDIGGIVIFHPFTPPDFGIASAIILTAEKRKNLSRS